MSIKFHARFSPEAENSNRAEIPYFIREIFSHSSRTKIPNRTLEIFYHNVYDILLNFIESNRTNVNIRAAFANKPQYLRTLTRRKDNTDASNLRDFYQISYPELSSLPYVTMEGMCACVSRIHYRLITFTCRHKPAIFPR